ncbi:MAG TPA: hypothetical protein PLK94_01565 [Alphaproteobacteria bacterium]|nr:hypothetical protein [Alphaproteobacteria bacterium]
MCLSQTVNSIGLVFDIVGIFILVKDQWRALPKVGLIGIIHGKKSVTEIINKFRIGVIFVIAGFIFQLISNFL